MCPTNAQLLRHGCRHTPGTDECYDVAIAQRLSSSPELGCGPITDGGRDPAPDEGLDPPPDEGRDLEPVDLKRLSEPSLPVGPACGVGVTALQTHRQML